MREGRIPAPAVKKQDGGVAATYRSPARTAVETPQPIDPDAQSAGPLTPENSIFASDLARRLGLTSPEAVNQEGRRLALSTAPAAVPKMTLPGLAGLLYGSSTSKAGEPDTGEAPPPKGPAAQNLDRVLGEYQSLQKRYDDAVKHRDLMLRGDPAMKIPPGQGPKTKAAEQVVNDLNEQRKGYTAPGGLISKAQTAADAEHQQTTGETGNKLSTKYPQSTWQQIETDILPGAAYPLGAIIGGITGHGVGRGFGARNQAATDRANALVTGRLPSNRGDVASRVDQFWTEGGSPEGPFVDRPGRRPPFASNPNQANVRPANELYPGPGLGQRAAEVGSNALGAAGYLGESYVAGNKLEEAKAEKAAAETAYAASPTKVNIERLNAARANVGFWEAAQTFGRMGAIGQGVGGLGTMLVRGNPRPDVAQASSLRRQLEAYLSQRLPPPSGGGGGGGGAPPPIPLQPQPPRQLPPPQPPQPPNIGGPGPGGGGGPQGPAGGGAPQPPKAEAGAAGSVARSQASKKPGPSAAKSKGNKPETDADASKIYDPNDPSRLTRGQAKGGFVQRIKRAMGGAVHAGPIQHAADGGRTDTVPLDVASGSYVIPADIISGLGQGDTTAGYKVLGRMFGPQAPRPGPDGKTVPIMAAGGEFVISPESVARVGRGDVKAGHDALDAWVRTERRKNIMALKKLPGPAKD